MSIEQDILNLLAVKNIISSDELNCKSTDIHGVLLSLSSKKVVDYTIIPIVERVLTPQGRQVEKEGSQEYNLITMLMKSNLSIDNIDKTTLKYAFKNKWIKMENNQIVLSGTTIQDITQKLLRNLDSISKDEFEELKKRKLVDINKKNIYKITRGENFNIEQKDIINELTTQNLFNISDTSLLKKYNFNLSKVSRFFGSLHPLTKIKGEFKRIFLEMGFSEMNTGKYVESSFWNFDSLFQPQNHPSREIQDTFFLKVPRLNDLNDVDSQYINRVESIHSSTSIPVDEGYDKCYSKGHNNVWSIAEAKKNILRTHTTAISSQMLYKLAQSNLKAEIKNYNIKLFSIDKVFRNETVDATHLAEFHQVEGLISGENLGIKELIHTIKTFFTKLNIHQIRFKPAFNPYTEPSMEIFGYHPQLKKWIELGNSGIFRPEMLLPMGFPKNVVVIAWGLSLERPAMIKLGLKNIRDLVGHKISVEFIRDSPVIFMNK